MKLLILFFLLIFNTIALSEDFIPLALFLKKEKNYNDINRTIYLLKRCASLHDFINSKKFEGYDKKIYLRYEKDSNFFYSKLSEILKIKLKIKNNLNDELKKDIIKFSQTYLKYSKKNMDKNGSYFKNTYLIEDLKICSKIQ
jgi:hypothetical protein